VVVWFALLVIALSLFLNRSRAKAEVGLTPEELRKKKVLEDMADRLVP
jgi:hypothetical protein